jgi:AcrR family transcriptional regulator
LVAPDRRVARTRRVLHRALIDLVLARGWEAVSVQEVCHHADVGRSTFYAHFADKEDLLVSGFDEYRAALRREYPVPSRDGEPLAFARALMLHAREYQPLLAVLVGIKSGQLAQRSFRQLVVDLVREDLSAVAKASTRLDASVHFLAGAFLETLAWWIEMPKPIDASEVEKYFHELAAPIIARLRR